MFRALQCVLNKDEFGSIPALSEFINQQGKTPQFGSRLDEVLSELREQLELRSSRNGERETWYLTRTLKVVRIISANSCFLIDG